jgi:iron complex transport system permease protein
MTAFLPVRRTRAPSPQPVPARLATRQAGLGPALAVAFGLLLVAAAIGLSLGAAGLPLSTVWAAVATHIPLVPHPHVAAVDNAIVWQIRAPRVVLAAIVGAMLAGGGATYQGVFRNPLADPYLLGVAAGGGLGATAIIVSGGPSEWLPVAAFAGAVLAVAVTYALGASTRLDSGTGASAVGNVSIVLAGVAVAALFTAVQTYLQQQHVTTIQEVYGWILGQLTLASWSDVSTVAPYAAVAAIVLLAGASRLDVLRVGEEEASTLGVDPARLRLVLIAAATLGTAAAVAVSGLIGFVGIIVPHTVRLTTSASYRVLLPVSMVAGGAFLILADVVARTVQAPAEIPLGVVTAMVGAPFFLYVLRSRRAREALS